MTWLVSLDLTNYEATKDIHYYAETDAQRYILKDPDIEMLTRNLTGLEELLLDGANVSDVVPEFFGEFGNLTSLHLSSCDLYGKFPEKILKLQTLRTLHLSYNYLLQGSLPEFPRNGLLQDLVIQGASFSGKLPKTIGNLRVLSRLDLSYSRFNGSIPTSISELNQLQYVDLTGNRLTGSIPSGFNRLSKLQYFNLAENIFTGTIPMDLITLDSLQELHLNENQFTGLSSDVLMDTLLLLRSVI
ncbi:receptor-like protein 7 [Papaver somniferum]|uniref:receptor-like protein 7 n=1 Tax=Papaver somniferum TaxID=3469 RepID=UPI000E6F5F1F|nr:receptor-like protein 7 [Papaver somniferum]